jgi:hypothetical protein
LARALEGSTRRVHVSFLDLYSKTRRRLSRVEPGGYPLAPAGWEESREARELIRDLADMAAASGMEMKTCAEPLSYAAEGAPPGRCVDPAMLSDLFPEVPFPAAKDPGQRRHCGCARSVDLGAADSCLHGCVYCYAVRSHKAALDAHARHDPSGDTLLPTPPPEPPLVRPVTAATQARAATGETSAQRPLFAGPIERRST